MTVSVQEIQARQESAEAKRDAPTMENPGPDKQDEGVTAGEPAEDQGVQTFLGTREDRENAEDDAQTEQRLLRSLGLQVDTAQGVFVVTPRRIQQLEGGARRLGCAAAANRRLVPARMLASFAGLAESSYLAVPLARFYLRELYWSLGDVSKTRLGWEGNVRLSKGALRRGVVPQNVAPHARDLVAFVCF